MSNAPLFLVLDSKRVLIMINLVNKRAKFFKETPIMLSKKSVGFISKKSKVEKGALFCQNA
jgi:hypothetical protein